VPAGDSWIPSVTVAAVVERDGRYLLVEEEVNGRLVLNEPAGHWERGETLVAACVRETLEETGYDFAPTALVGIYRWHYPDGRPRGLPAEAATPGVTFLRFAFAGDLVGWSPQRALDHEIRRVLWLDAQAIDAETARHRSPLVARCVRDHRAGKRYPLEALVHVE
jgi:8-oxo-dGTP pyrophosphatase MutT (NUDIX family)